MKLDNCVPAGIPASSVRSWVLLGGGGIPLLFSLDFIRQYFDAYDRLFASGQYRKILLDGAVMTPFASLLSTPPLLGLLCAALVMTGLLVYYILYHYQGSKSIYLMRRLPQRGELLRRCVSVPLLGLLTAVLVTFLLVVLCYALYMWVTPPECILPGQWQRIWNGGIFR
ncbi:MAG: hypothetical protein GXW99_10940 [Clostridiales bacterium]|nr:hypothetical protein [Clostridiales bacterium]